MDISRNALAVSTHTTLSIDKVVRLADGADALGHRLSLRADALTLLVCRLRFRGDLLQACGGLWEAARSPLCRRVACALKLPLSLLKSFLSRGGRLCKHAG